MGEIVFAGILALLLMNVVIGFIHIKIFLKEFHLYRQRGKVLVGQQKNMLKGLATIMFVLDNNGIIICTKYTTGFTLFPKFKEIDLYINRPISDLKFLLLETKQLNKKLVGAVQDAVKKWQNFHY